MQDYVYDFLNTNGIIYTKHEHHAVFTVEEANALYGDIPGAHTKNLFLKNKDASQFYLYVIASHKRADLKHIAELVGEKKLFFGTPEELLAILGLTPGSVSALGLINDTEQRVRVVVDKELWESEQVNAHPNTNTATLTFTQDDFRKIFNATGHEVLLVS